MDITASRLAHPGDTPGPDDDRSALAAYRWAHNDRATESFWLVVAPVERGGRPMSFRAGLSDPRLAPLSDRSHTS